ncbi:GNAT family N-acetyltransferase [Polluticoccus soli]|uniref:GNAT family N-acetyltransferase n=1 Tax=Polluticoccus soli TaxID=3034150 RepID=UPI0023E22A41|nr:GNAT family N-acetyltransferase [Flavipsychrobacter sp. JY13-12]
MNNQYTIRLAAAADAAGMLNVYKYYVENTAYTFEYDVPSVEEFESRIRAVISGFPWLVCEIDDRIVGYAYAHKHRDRTAYQWSPESTIYIDRHYHGKGLARVLYETLFDILKLQGFFNVYAGVLSTNENSCAFHKAVGFEEIGLFRNIGYKHGKWHSNMWYQLHLRTHYAEPSIPTAFSEMKDSPATTAILNTANFKLTTLHNCLKQTNYEQTTPIQHNGNLDR